METGAIWASLLPTGAGSFPRVSGREPTVSTEAAFLGTSPRWSICCKIRFKMREWSASLKAEVSRSRYPRTCVITDAVEAMPGVAMPGVAMPEVADAP